MNDLEQLRDDVRATAPEPRPEYAARLERRVEAGFKPAKPVKERRRIDWWTPGIALGFTALIALVLAIGPISGGGDDEDAGSGGSGQVAATPMEDEAELNAQESSGGSAAAPVPEARSFDRQSGRARGRDGNRVVVQRTSLDLETGADKFTEVTDDILRVADDTSSIVQRSSVSEENGRGFARYDLRVPSSRLDETLADLSRLAHVTSRNASSEDITRAYVSATDRLDDARAERQALLKALEKADTDAEADAIRRQIRLARDRIAIAQRDVEALQRRADRSRVTVTVRSTGRKTEGGAWTPGDALDDAGRILEVAAGVIVVSAAALLPLALLGILGVLGARSMKRRRREAALEPR